MTDFLTREIQRIEKYQNQHHESFYQYFRHLTTVCVGLFGLLVALNPLEFSSIHSKIFYLLALSLIGLTILFSLISQYYSADYYMRTADLLKDMLPKILDDPNGVESSKIEKPKVFLICEIATYICLSLSIISLIYYSYFVLFK